MTKQIHLSPLNLIVVCFLLASVGCAKKEELHMTEGKGGKKLGGTYRLNEIRGNPSSLDPVRMNTKIEDDIGSNIFDKLIDNNAELQLVPELSSLPDISANGLVYTFHLRPDVVFQDDAVFPNGKGRRMTSRDVQYSFERVCDPKTTTVGYWIFQDLVKGANAYFDGRAKSWALAPAEVTGFSAPNDTTFVITLVKPYAPFLQHLTTSFAYIVPKEAIEKYGKDFFQHPVGTGPFVFDHWSPDQEIVLKKNPNYWQFDDAGNRLPLLDEVKFLFIKEDKTLLANFERGILEEDFTLPTEEFQEIVTPEKTLTPKYKDKYLLQHVPAMNTYFFDFLTTGKIFSNMPLRRAVSFAIDRNQINKYVLKGMPHGAADHGIVPPAFSRYPINDVQGITFNLDSANYWLEKAGYPKGKGIPAITISVYNEPRTMQIAEAVQHMLQRNLGAKVELNVLQASQLLDLSDDGKLDFWLTRWYADYPEIENFLNLMNGDLVPSDPAMKSYPNNTRWKNQEFMDLFHKAIATTDEAERMKLYAAAENVAAFHAPNVPLFYEEHYRLMQNYVRDNPLDPTNRIDLKYVWLDK